MRSVAFLLLVGTVVSASSLRAQDPSPPTFRAGTTLIEFTIVARDSQGNPVADLTKDDISVTEQGQLRPIEFFRFDGALPQPSQTKLPAGHYTNRFETSPNAARHLTAILIDAMNMMAVAKTLQFTQATIRSQMVAYLDGLPPHSRVGMFRLGRGTIDVLHDFTDDVASLRAQVAKMDLLLPELFDTPGHRPADAPPSGVSGSAESAASRATAEAAFAKGTGAVNEIVQTNRVDLTLPGLDPIAQPAKDLTPESVREALNLFADTTGGRVTFTMNDPMEALKTTALDQRAIYSVGFYAVAAPDNAWHPISVKVRRPNVTVTHRQGYLSEAPAVQPLEWGEEQWRTALANPLSSSVVRLDGQIAPAAGAAARTVDFRMRSRSMMCTFAKSAARSSPTLRLPRQKKSRAAIGRFGLSVQPSVVRTATRVRWRPTLDNGCCDQRREWSE